VLRSFALSLPSTPESENEDAIVVTRDIGVVVDGAGLPKSMRAGCSHSVAWFAQSIAHEFHAALTTRCSTMADALAKSIAQVRDSHAAACDFEAGSPGATVAAWRFSQNELEYLVLCDASVLLVDADGRCTQITDRRLEQAVDRATRELVERTADRASIAALRRTARVQVDADRNREGGWWVINDDPAAAEHALTGRRRSDDLIGAVACSDGATRAFDLLSTHTLDQFAALCISGRAEEIATHIRHTETDTACALRDEGMKTHDDLTVAASSW